jgi:autotransporter passenger strand-loop-strand repeat protein
VVGGGTAIATRVASGGVINAVQGVVSGATIQKGAVLHAAVLSGGVKVATYGTNLLGTEIDGDFALAVGTKIGRGGVERIGAFGTASATVVSAGGRLIVGSNGTAKTVTLDGGTEVVANGGVMDQRITFGQHGTLSIAKTVLAPHVAKFGATDKMILTAFAFGGALKHSFVENAAKTQGVLKITEGAKTANITLFGQYVAAGFHFAKDGAGTAITYAEPPAAQAQISVSHT